MSVKLDYSQQLDVKRALCSIANSLEELVKLKQKEIYGE